VTDVWVVDASPLIILGQVGKLELLEQLSSQLFVPAAVVKEILAGPEDSAHRALLSGWGERRHATVPEIVAEWSLGQGESAVIALALELGATAVVDDRSARRCARAVGTSVIGTLGVIIRAKRQGLIDAAAPIIRSVLDAGLFYEDQAVRRLVEDIGERWP
jgi:predicted nucleic acid-binding protein